MDRHAVEDMGLSTDDLNDLVTSFNWLMDNAYDTILKRGKFTWNQFWNNDETAWIDCPDPMVRKESCAADVRSLCQSTSYAQKYAMVYTFSPGCHGSTSKIIDPYTDIAAFLLTRGGHAWYEVIVHLRSSRCHRLGHGWSGCSKVYERPKELDWDYGEPLGLCQETAPNSGVFVREWTKSTIKLDCNTWNATMTIK